MTAITAEKATRMVPRDFPGWLPPMLVKELRQGLRTKGFVGTLVGFQLVMLVLTLAALGTQSAATVTARAAGASFSTGFFWAVLSVQMLIITPSRALGGLQSEAEAKTLDLLVLTRLTAWRIVLGKWISLLAQAVLLLIAMLPYLIIRYFTDNADLISELARCLMMLGLCAVLTAAGLWGSGVGKLVRVVMAIAMGVFMVNLLGVFGSGVARVGVSRSPFGNLIEMPFDIFNGLFLTAFFLVSAVRNIAPLAENHSLFTRALPLLMLLPVPFAEALKAHGLAVRQLFLSAGFLGFVLLFELGVGRNPMPAQWRDWYRRGGLMAWMGRAALPGWPSAFLFGTIATAAWIACAFTVLPLNSVSQLESAKAAWLAVLAFSGIVFPAVLQSLVRVLPVPALLLYFSGLGVPALLAGVGLWLAESRWRFTELKSLMETMPFSSFLFGLNARDQSPLILTAQAAVAALVLALALWQGRSYWQQLVLFEARDRANEKAVAQAARKAG